MPAIHAGMTMIFIFILCGRAQDHESLRGALESCFGFCFATLLNTPFQ
jgi:hypothetical protein